MEIRKIVGALAVTAALGWTSRGLADIPPVDACSTSGASCTNAGVHGDEAGTCTAAECRRRTPDGEFVTYACLRCVVASAGSGGAGGSDSASGGDSNGGTSSNSNGGTNSNGGAAAAGGPTAAGGMAGATTLPDDHHESSSGCSISRLPGKHGLASALLGFGLAALCVSRRQR